MEINSIERESGCKERVCVNLNVKNVKKRNNLRGEHKRYAEDKL